MLDIFYLHFSQLLIGVNGLLLNLINKNNHTLY